MLIVAFGSAGMSLVAVPGPTAWRCQLWRRISVILANMKSLLRNPLLVDAAIVLALLLVAVVGYHYSPLLLPQADLTMTADAACNLNRQACRVPLADGGSVELTILPRPIPVVSPLTIEAKLNGIAGKTVELDFAGVDMQMGHNRVVLSPTGNGVFSSTASLPVCVTGRMNWRATLLIDSGGRHLSVAYDFTAPSEAGSH